MNEGIGGDFRYSRSHGTAHMYLDTMIAGGWDLVVVVFSNLIYCNLYISPGLMFFFLGGGVIFQDLCILFISKIYLVLLL